MAAALLLCAASMASAQVAPGPDDPASVEPAADAAFSAAGSAAPAGSLATDPASPQGSAPSRVPYRAPTLGPDTGSVVFNDDFVDLGNGWPSGAPSANTSFEFLPGNYIIHASGAGIDHLISAPYSIGYPWLAVTVTGGLVPTHATAGLGVTCRRGADAHQVTYEFVVYDRGGWVLERRDGPPSMGAGPTVLAQGNAPAGLGPDSTTIVGVCDSVQNGLMTHLAFYANGQLLYSSVDFTGSQPGGWLGGFVVVSGDLPITVVVAHFQERRKL